MQTILIAEDNDELRELLAQFLGANGYGVIEAADGREAVEAALGRRPDLVLMDLGMPGADGRTAVKEIRREVPPQLMPILMVSAYDRIEFRTEAVSVGCSGFVTKPVDLPALLRTVRLLLPADGAGAAPPR